MIPFRRLALGFAFLYICGAQPAAASGLFNQDTQGWFYIAPDSLPATLLPPPPTSGSSAERKQVMAVLDAQKHISASDKVAMRDEQHVRLALMTDVLGPDFTPAAHPKTFALLDRVTADTRLLSEADKNFWHTKRPYLVDHRVKLGVDPLDSSPAYPSGHTCFARVIAEVLGMIYPDRLADLRARADAIAWHRVEAGVHYPVDLDGGRLLAMQIIGALRQKDDFRDDLDAAQREALR